MKKLISVALATIMVMSLACTAFASSGNDKLTRSGTFNGTYLAPTINVTLPTTGKISLNPYKLKYKETVGTDVFESRDSIAFYPQSIINESNVGVDISVVVTGKPTNITLEKASVKKTDGTDAKTTKSAYMYVWFSEATATEVVVTPADEDNDVEAVTETVYTAKWDPQPVVDEDGAPVLDDNDNQTYTDSTATPIFSGDGLDAVLIQSTASKDTKVLTLGEPVTTQTAVADADGKEPDDDDWTPTYEDVTTPTYGVYKIGGDMVSRPATAYDAAKDKVDVTFAWTIIPLVAEQPVEEVAEEEEGG